MMVTPSQDSTSIPSNAFAYRGLSSPSTTSRYRTPGMLSTPTRRDTGNLAGAVDRAGEARRASARPPPTLHGVRLRRLHERPEDPKDREEDPEEEHPPVPVS